MRTGTVPYVQEGSASGRVYVVAYREPMESELRLGNGPQSDEFVRDYRRDSWPYDVGDDPAFWASRRFAREGGAVTWGICRRDLRNSLREGDTVAFFAFHQGDPEIDYRFVGFATVDTKISQQEIWETRGSIYQQYLNLLMRFDGSVIEHFEPQPGDEHDDWLWRMTDYRGAKSFARYKDARGGMRVNLTTATVNGRPLRLARNYVIFSRDSTLTHVLREPPHVAQAQRRSRDYREVWDEDDRACAIRKLALPEGLRRGLRTSGTGFSHAKLRLPIQAERWRTTALDVMSELDLDAV